MKYKLTALAALALLSSSAIASSSDFVLIAPVQSFALATSDIKLNMTEKDLGFHSVGTPLSLNLNSLLQITGDPKPAPSATKWSLTAGRLPAGVSLSEQGLLTGEPTALGETSFSLEANYKRKVTNGSFTLFVGSPNLFNTKVLSAKTYAGEPFELNLSPVIYTRGGHLVIDDVTLSSSDLPSGLSINGTSVSGTPGSAGKYAVKVSADAALSKDTLTLDLDVGVRLKNFGTYRGWSDGSIAQSCNEYRQGSNLKEYSGATGTGVYRITMNGAASDVFCEMDFEGGGWTLLMKQAQGDGATLRGDSGYWTNGTTLNDNASNLSMNNGNFVSAAFKGLPITELRMQASNESIMQSHSVSRKTAWEAFSDSNRTNGAFNTMGGYPNWMVHSTVYPNGRPISQAQFFFNRAVNSPIQCAVRWGWIVNETGSVSSPDVCFGFGGYGSAYGGSWMNNSVNVWQLATLYMWAR